MTETSRAEVGSGIGRSVPAPCAGPILGGRPLSLLRYLAMRIFTLLLVLLLCACQRTAGPVHVTDRITLHPPLTLVELSRWRDGGSLGFHVEDAQAQQLVFSVDYRINSTTRGRWYLGAMYPTDSGAVLLDEGGRTELALRDVLRDWVNQHYGKQEQTDIASQGWNDTFQDDRIRFDAWTIMTLLTRPKAS